MEFWSTEVKSGETLKVKANEDQILHLSQASLGEVKKTKGNESVYLYVTVDEKKLVLGTLSSEKLPQLQFDLIFDRDFELSHSLKGASVYFFGYKRNYDGDSEDDESEDDGIPLSLDNAGKPETKVTEEKPADAQKAQDDDDDSSDDDDDDDDSDDDSEDDSGDEEDESDEEVPEPVKAEPGKKRALDKEPETPASKKKVKLTTPEKTDGKKGSGVHVDTPHPSKKAGKTSAAAATPNQKTAKSGGGSSVCKSCSRTFGSESALDSHTKAKHGSGK